MTHVGGLLWTDEKKPKKTDQSAVCMALRCAGLGAGALNTDDVHAAADAFASLRSRSLAVQVRVHAAATRDRMLLDNGAAVSRLFFNITNFLELALQHLVGY